MREFDLVVIGSGPAGEKAAVKAAYHGHSVLVIEKNKVVGGAGTNTGTLPSKTLKETSLYYSGFYDKGLFGVDKQLERAAESKDFFFRKNHATEEQNKWIEANFKLHGIELSYGTASFVDEHTIEIDGGEKELVSGKNIIIATGSHPFQPPGIPFDGKCIHDSDTILNIDQIPRSLVIVGAGVIGCEYATIFGVMGCQVKLINSRGEILTFLDHEIRDQLIAQFAEDGIELVLNSRVEDVELLPDWCDNAVQAKLTNGDKIEADMFLYAAGRRGSSGGLNLDALKIETGDRGQILVDEDYRTRVPHIFAVGDVIGFPALASTSMEQGRIAATHALGLETIEKVPAQFPFGIYTIPEMSAYGMTEQEAKQKGVEYRVGRAHYQNMPRGRIMGVDEGMLKLLFEAKTQRIIGVHIFGKIATELVHYGMSLIDNEETLGDIIGRVYNSPTLHELYKYAAYNGLIEGEHGEEKVGY